MNAEPDLDIEWACEKIPGFKKFKEQADAAEADTKAYRERFAGCPRPVPKEERKAA